MHPRKNPHPELVIAPIAVKPRGAAIMLSMGLTRVYELLNAGELVSYHDGSSRLITVDSIRAYVARKIAQTEVNTPAAVA